MKGLQPRAWIAALTAMALGPPMAARARNTITVEPRAAARAPAAVALAPAEATFALTPATGTPATPATSATTARTQATPGAPPRKVAAITWNRLANGADRATIATEVGEAQIQLFRFDLTRFRPEVVVGAGWPPRRHTAGNIVHDRGAVTAVNGGFFDARIAPLGLRVAATEVRAPLRPKADWGVLVFSERGARIIHTREFPPDLGTVRDAIQVGPRLIVAGVPVHLKPQAARRTAVALDRDGRTLTVVVVDDPIDANDLAVRLADAGFDSALLLDGGPSTQFALDLGSEKIDVPGGYPVPDLLAIFALPSSTAPTRAVPTRDRPARRSLPAGARPVRPAVNAPATRTPLLTPPNRPP